MTWICGSSPLTMMGHHRNAAAKDRRDTIFPADSQTSSVRKSRNIQHKVIENGGCAKRRKVGCIETEKMKHPPGPESDESVPSDFGTWSVEARSRYVNSFWDLRKGTNYYVLGRVKDLEDSAIEAMDLMFRTLDFGGETQMELSDLVCLFKYRWSGRRDWVVGMGCNRHTAQLDAAVQALSILMTPREFERANAISISILPPAAASSCSSSTSSRQEPDSTTSPDVEDTSAKFLNFSENDFRTMPLAEREELLVEFWGRYVSEEADRFPQVCNLMNNYNSVGSSKAGAFSSLFAGKSGSGMIPNTWKRPITEDRWCSSSGPSSHRPESSQRYCTTSEWRVNGVYYKEIAHGSSRYAAENQASAQALSTVIGESEYELLCHMNQQILWANISKERIKELILQKRNQAAAEQSEPVVEVTKRALTDLEELTEYLSKSGELDEAQFETTAFFSAKCTIRGKRFESSICSSEKEAKNEAAMGVLQHLFKCTFKTLASQSEHDTVQID